MSFAKDRKLLIGGLVLLGLSSMALAVVHHGRPESAEAARLPGPRPGPMLMAMAVTEALRQRNPDPNAFEEPELYQPSIDHLGDRACWRFPFSYRARTLTGGMAFHHGSFWVKDGRVIREQWD